MSSPLDAERACQYIRSRLEPVCGSLEQLEAELRLLLEGVLGVTSAQRYSGLWNPVGEVEWARLEALLERRAGERIPIQYLLGEAWFYGLSFCVTPDVLIPRPETEILVEKTVAICREKLATKSACRVLDLGTGSGAVALALAHGFSEDMPAESVEIVSVDISTAALVVAQENAGRLGLSGRVDFRLGDWFEPVSGERFDVIVSNPPYIADEEKAAMAPEVLEHEPELALFPSVQGRDRLYFYRQLAEEGPGYLNPAGVMLMEMGQGMTPALCALFSEAQVFVEPDYAGMDRVLVVKY